MNECAVLKENRGPAGFFLSSRRVPALRRDLRHVYHARRLALLATDRCQKAEHEDHCPHQYCGEYDRGQHFEDSPYELRSRAFLDSQTIGHAPS
jgi:hypothetical protein